MKPMYIVVNLSGGKDSSAMLLQMVERGEHIDEVVTCDTYKEFPAMYRHLDKLKALCKANGIKYTELRCKDTYDYLMFEHVPNRRNKSLTGNAGYSWAGTISRWCTSKLKTDVINRYFKELKQTYDVINCIGIAFDEGYRLDRQYANGEGVRFPLVEWEMTEKDCLQFCYSRGYDWEGLYEIFHRVSCWCCPLQSLEELRNLRKHFPDLWEELKDMDRRTWRKFKADYSVEQLEKRFEFEEERIAQGLSITNRDFYTELKKITK